MTEETARATNYGNLLSLFCISPEKNIWGNSLPYSLLPATASHVPSSNSFEQHANKILHKAVSTHGFNLGYVYAKG